MVERQSDQRASELSQVHVADPRGPQLCSQGLLVELRVVGREHEIVRTSMTRALAEEPSRQSGHF
jgi:hypothetical protein